MSAANEEEVMLGDLFDPKAEIHIHEHCRPHWSQAGAVVFITFRTHDSIPREVVERWDAEKRSWLATHGFACRHWSDILPALPGDLREKFKKTFNRQREAFLDTCHGRCLLRNPTLAKIVADALLHFDGDRYRMGDFIIMPNHVHLLAVFADSESLKRQCDSWLHYTAVEINRRIGEKGKFWQQEPSDHLVRSPAQYEYLRDYIAENPKKARLTDGDYFYRRFPG